MRTADPATGQQSYGKVARTFVGEVEKILEVETADGARVKATEDHPFFVEGRGFVAARKLARGDLLRRVDGRRVAVVGLGWEETRTRVYNFEVEGTHTYYAAGVWVHNARPCLPDDLYEQGLGPKGRFPHHRPNPDGGGDYTLLRYAEDGGLLAAQTYDADGYAVNRIDFGSRSGRRDHPFPHYHPMNWEPNARVPGGAPQVSKDPILGLPDLPD